VLVGADGIERKVQRWKQLASRISQWVHFQAADLHDVGELARHYQSPAAPDLLEVILEQSRGNVRQITVALSRVRAYASANGLKLVTFPEWEGGKQELFLGQGRKGG